MGENYFDMQRDPFIHDGSAVLFGDGEPVAWYNPIVMNTEEEL